MNPPDCQYDLAMGVALLVGVSGLLFWGGRNVALRCPAWLTRTAAVIAFAATLGFVARCYGQLDLATLLPLPGVIVLSNWLPPCVAVLAGIVAGHASIPQWRRTATVGMLIGLAWYTVAHDLFAAAPQPARPRFLDGACMQTTADSCSVCCAVTLLSEYGIAAHESEMMQLCLTRHGGTPELGLFRGLKLKTKLTPWDVEVLSCPPEAFLDPDLYPVLLLVRVDSFELAGERPWWRPQQADHAVLAYGLTESGRIDIRDPSSGRTTWTFDHFRQSWLGDGLRLVPRH